jgi:hypothetical protein
MYWCLIQVTSYKSTRYGCLNRITERNNHVVIAIKDSGIYSTDNRGKQSLGKSHDPHRPWEREIPEIRERGHYIRRRRWVLGVGSWYECPGRDRSSVGRDKYVEVGSAPCWLASRVKQVGVGSGTDGRASCCRRDSRWAVQGSTTVAPATRRFLRDDR